MFTFCHAKFLRNVELWSNRQHRITLTRAYWHNVAVERVVFGVHHQFTLTMEALSFSETSANIYQTTHCNIREDSHLHTRCCENLKSPWECLFAKSDLYLRNVIKTERYSDLIFYRFITQFNEDSTTRAYFPTGRCYSTHSFSVHA
jgi:hypothetical protein